MLGCCEVSSPNVKRKLKNIHLMIVLYGEHGGNLVDLIHDVYRNTMRCGVHPFVMLNIVEPSI